MALNNVNCIAHRDQADGTENQIVKRSKTSAINARYFTIIHKPGDQENRKQASKQTYRRKTINKIAEKQNKKQNRAVTSVLYNYILFNAFFKCDIDFI